MVEELGQLQGGQIRQATLRLRARGTARVTGTVLWDDARPAEGVRRAPRTRFGSGWARTDLRGQFSLEGLEAGPTTVKRTAQDDSTRQRALESGDHYHLSSPRGIGRREPRMAGLIESREPSWTQPGGRSQASR